MHLAVFLAFSSLFSQIVSQILQEEDIPGLAAVVVVDGKLSFYQEGYADLEKKKPVTEDTLFEIASITKVFTSTGIAYEVVDGNLKLEDPVKGLKGSKLIDLATHTSGLPRAPPKHQQESKSRLYRYLEEWTPSHPVGTHYSYSNLGFELLRDAFVEAAKSPSYFDALKTIILQPLAMDSTFLEVPAPSLDRLATLYNYKGKPVPPTKPKPWPGGGALKSTAKDMAPFLRANMGLTGPPKLKEAMQLAQKPVFQVDESFSMGLGWNIVRYHALDLIDKDGGLKGSSSYIGFTKDKRVGLVLLTNKGEVEMKKVGRSLLHKLHKRLTTEQDEQDTARLKG